MNEESIRMISANGLSVPALGQGGWRLGDNPEKELQEIAALRLGLKRGLSLIDTAEMYGEGRSEQLIGRALSDYDRSKVFLVSKVYPHNAGRPQLFTSCEASLRRLNTDYLDLYLLHWRGNIPLRETVEGMEELVRTGKIRRWGVSNFDTEDMEELWSIPGGQNCAVNQVLYHLGSRGIEFDLLPWLRAHQVAAMAYCPIAQAGSLHNTRRTLLANATITDIAMKHGITVMQLLLAFVLHQEGVIAIPKAGSPAHVEENAKAAHLILPDADWSALNHAFPAPTTKTPLDMQ